MNIDDMLKVPHLFAIKVDGKIDVTFGLATDPPELKRRYLFSIGLPIVHPNAEMWLKIIESEFDRLKPACLSIVPVKIVEIKEKTDADQT